MTPPAARPGRQQLTVFGFLMLTQFVATMDTQIVATAIPTIVGELGQAERFGWLVSAYVLAQCAVMPIYGKLGDLIGRKVVVLAALAIFLVGSALCAASWSMTSLIAARTLQGLGNGGLLVSVFAVGADLFEPRTRARFQGYLSFVFVLGSFVGPTLGGYLTETLGWRSIFFVNLVPGLAAMAGFLIFMPRHISDRRPVIDYAGAITLALAVTLVVTWVDSPRVFGGFASAPSLGFAAAAILAAAAWVAVERRAPEPVLPLGLLARRDFALLVGATVACGAVSVGLVNYYAYFLQMGLGKSPTDAGLYFIAITVGVSSGALVSGRLMSRGVPFTTPLRVSLALSAAMLVVFSWATHHVWDPALAAMFVVQGVSTGLAMNATVLGAQVSAPRGDVGAATGAISLVRTVGAAVAIAVFGTILARGIEGLGQGGAMTPGRMAALAPEARADLLARYTDSFEVLFLCAASIALAGFGAACLIRRPRDDG